MPVLLNLNTQRLQQIREEAELVLQSAIEQESAALIEQFRHDIPDNDQTRPIYIDVTSRFEAHSATKHYSENRNKDKQIQNHLRAHVDNIREINETKFQKYRDDYVDGKPYTDSSIKTRMRVGPLTFKSSVQSVQVVEPKRVEEFATSRRGASFLMPTGETRPIINVNFLFPSIEAINYSLRPLIALFKICPITVVDDEFIKSVLGGSKGTKRLSTFVRRELLEEAGDFVSNLTKSSARAIGRVSSGEVDIRQALRDVIKTLFSRQDTSVGTDLMKNNAGDALGSRTSAMSENISNLIKNAPNTTQEASNNPSTKTEVTDEQLREEFARKERSEKIKSDERGYVPVALTNLSISTHPDLPQAIMAQLSMVRVSLDTYSNFGVLWRDERGDPVANPARAFYLITALNKEVDKIPLVDDTDIATSSILSAYGSQVKFETNIESLDGIETLRLDFGDQTYHESVKQDSLESPSRSFVVKGLQGALSNHFSFPTIIGKEYPTVQHMGRSNVHFSMAIASHSTAFNQDLNAYKSRIDQVLRSEFYEERVYGVQVSSVITKLLQKDDKPFHFVNLSTNTDPQHPGVYHIDMSMAENSLDFVRDQLITIRRKKYNVDEIKDLWDRLWDLAESGIDKILQKGGAEDFFDNLNALAENKEKDDYIKYRAILLLYGIAFGSLARRPLTSHENPIDQTNPGGSEPVNTGVLFGGNIVSSRAGIVSLPLVINALYNQYTDFTESRLFRDNHDRTYRELKQKYIPTSPIGQIISAFVLELRTQTGVGKAFDSLPIDIRNNIDEFVGLLDQHVFQQVAGDSSFSERSKRQVAAAILMLSDRRLIGDISSVPVLLRDAGVTFTQKFRDAMFEVIYYDPNAWQDIKVVISDVGHMIRTAKRHLIDEYHRWGRVYLGEKHHRNVGNRLIQYHSNTTNVISAFDENLEQFRDKIENNYSDFDLPTYYDMFGSSWYAFAPTYDEVGALAPASKYASFADHPDGNNEDPQRMTFVSANDKVPPSIFFYNPQKEFKDQMRSRLKEFASDDIDNNEKYNTGLDFDIKEVRNFKIIGEHENTLAHRVRTELSAPDSRSRRKAATSNSAVGAILNQLTREDRQKIVEAGFDEANFSPEDYMNLLFDEETGLLRDLKMTIEDPDGIQRRVKVGLMIGIHHGGMRMPEYRRTNPAVSSQIIRGVVTKFPKEHALRIFGALDEGYTYGLPHITSDISEMKEYRQLVIDKAMNAAPDIQFDSIRAFPTFRFYLLDEQQHKFVYQDTFVGLNAIQNIKIVRDKDLASTAEIQLADPLRLIQNQLFDNALADPDPLIVDRRRARRRQKNRNSLKIHVGRPIQIRMGYCGHPEGLNIVFTGRITEIVPGDIITIVAQDWKHELQSQEISLKLAQSILGYFNNSVKDLVVAAIRESSVQGFGEIYSPSETQELASLGMLTNNTLYNQAQAQGQNTALDGLEALSMGPLSALSPADQTDLIGVDTRLKNIWVPDAPKSLGRYLTNPHAWTKEWIVPMQPVWDVLQEASRHVLGHICDVVPFDSRATIFFGRPDQLYFYTEISPEHYSDWRKSAYKTQQQSFKVLFEEVFQGFFVSEYFASQIKAISRDPNPNSEQRAIFNKKSDLINGPIVWKTFDSRVNAAELAGVYAEDPSYIRAFERVTNRVPSGGVDINEIVISPILANTFDPTRTKKFIELQMRNEDKISRMSEFSAAAFQSANNGILSLAQHDARPDRKYIQDAVITNFMDILFALFADAGISNIESFSRREEIYDIILGPWASRAQDGSWTDDMSSLRNRAIIATSGNTEGAALSSLNIFGTSNRIEQLRNIRKDRVSKLRSVLGLIIEDINFQNTVGTYGLVPIDPEVNPVVVNSGSEEKPIPDIQVKNGVDHWDPRVSGRREHQYHIQRRKLIDEIRQIDLQIESDAKFAADVSGAEGSTDSVDPRLRNLFKIFMGKFADVGGDENLQERLAEKDILYFLDRNLVRIKLFVIFFAKYIEDSSEDKTINFEKVRRASQSIAKSAIAPNMAAYRQYHYINSDNDILDNSIYATTREMANTVIIQHPQEISDENWQVSTNGGTMPVFRSAPRYWPSKDLFGETGLSFSPGVHKNIKKVKVVSEMNVDQPDRAAVVAMSNLASCMRNMYRGSLMMLGKDMKPWDTIILDDTYSDMEGPLDVERVIHNFGPEFGWITEVQPHLICHGNPGSMILDIAEQQTTAQLANKAVDIAFTTFAIVSFLPLLGGAAAGATSGATVLGGSRVALKGLAGPMRLVTKILGASPRKGAVAGLGTKVGAGLRSVKGVLSNPGTTAAVTSRLSVIKEVGGRFIGRGIQVYAGVEMARLIGNGIHNINIMQQMHTAYADSNSKLSNGMPRLCPVVFSPLKLYGRPFVAGVETAEPLYNTVGWNNYASWNRIKDSLTLALNGADLGPIPESVVEESR